jgi:GT2 family glycosyltransferase
MAATAPTLDLSIIIVNWNTSALLGRALACVFATVRRARYEVIVVDNASSDDSVAMVDSQYPDVRLLVNQENAGFARANNQAAAVAQGRYLLLLNPDAFVYEGAVDRLVSFLDAHATAGAAGCRLLNADGTLQRSCTTFPTIATELWTALWLDKLFPRHAVFGRYQMMSWDMNDLREVDALMGACLIVRRAAIEDTCLFDEQFFMYSEEVDLCFRLQRSGWKVFFIPDAQATHIWGGSADKVPAESLLRLYRSRVLFFRKHYGAVSAAFYKLVLLLGSVLRIVLGLAVFAIRRNRDIMSRARNHWLLLRAIWAF